MSNCIIYYNAKLLDALLTKLQKGGDEGLIQQLKYISPVAWRHINFHGYYTFEGQQSAKIDMARLTEVIDIMKMV